MPDPNSHKQVYVDPAYHMGKLPSTWWLHPWYAVRQIDNDRQRILNREGSATRRINDLEHQVFLLEDVTKMKYPGEYSTIGVGPAALDRLTNMHEFYTNRISQLNMIRNDLELSLANSRADVRDLESRCDALMDALKNTPNQKPKAKKKAKKGGKR